MNTASFKILTAAILLALGTSACADYDDDQASARTAVTTTPSPTSSTADGNTAQSTTEGATASSFESGTATAPAGTTGTAGTTGVAGTLDTGTPATGSTAALAGARPTFESLDVDRDGFIARSEVPADNALLTTWAEYDADNDARIARSDFDRYLIAAYPNFADLDKDADGTLSRAELPSTHVLYSGFATYDTDADTRLSRAEFDAYGAGAAPVASTTDTTADETDTDETD